MLEIRVWMNSSVLFFFFSLFLEGGDKDHFLYTQQKVSVGDGGILVSSGRQTVKVTFKFRTRTDTTYVFSAFKLIPSGSSPEVWGANPGSRAWKGLMCHRAAKSKACLLEQVPATFSYSSKHHPHWALSSSQNETGSGELGPIPCLYPAGLTVQCEGKQLHSQ